MKILITGGAGFIGSHLVEALINEGKHIICVVDNLETGNLENLPSNPGPHIINNVDIADLDMLHNVFISFQPNIVVHAAASYRDHSNWVRDAAVNTMGTAAICNFSRQYKVSKIIYLQTSLCYGHPQEVPITLSHPVNPMPNSYAITKTAGEQLIAMSGVPFVSFRLSNCYGPRNLSGAIPTFYKRLTEKQRIIVVDTRRDLTFVDDLVKILMRTIQGEGKQSYYHVSSGSDYSIEKVLKMMVDIMNVRLGNIEIDYRERGPDDVETILLDPKATHMDFPGWYADTSLRFGLTRAIEWYETHGVKETFTHLR